MSSKRPTVIVKNNTGANVPVPLFQYGGIPSSINATRQYRYATPPSVFPAAGIVTIQVRGDSSQPYRTYSAPVGARTPEGVVEALNGLNLGTIWYTKEIDGDTYIITDNDTLQFGDLTLSSSTAVAVNTVVDLLQAVASYTLSANGTQIDSLQAVDSDTLNFDANPGVVLAIHVDAQMPVPSFINVTVIKNTTLGPEEIINHDLLSTEDYNASFTVEADVLSYDITVNTFFPP